ncbi:MAG: DUF2142 domain-containing protein [Terracidiphilus sp.]
MKHRLEERITGWLRISKLLSGVKAIRVALALTLGAIGAIPLILFTPPFQVPDENWHFYRAYELSEFKILSEVRNGVSGADLPDSLPQLVKQSVYTRDEILYPATPAPLAQTMSHASILLNSSVRHFVAFPGSAYYSPLPYLPQALGIAVGRLFGLGPLGLLYLGRLFNCLTALGLVGFAVYTIPFAEEMILLVGLLPMSLYLYASLSPDAALIGCALVFIALSLAAVARGSWKAWELSLAAVSSAVFCVVKPVYIPLLLAGLVPHLFQRRKIASVIRSHAILLAVALGATMGWMLLAHSSMTPPLDGAHPSDQMRLIIHNPMVFVRALANSLGPIQIFVNYLETVGIFGWLTVAMSPGIIYILPLAGLVILGILGIRTNMEFPLTRRLWLLALFLVSAFLIYLAMYLLTASVGQDKIIGVQGRYFIPILALAGLSAIRPAPAGLYPTPAWYGSAAIAVIVLLQIASMDATILRAFQVF